MRTSQAEPSGRRERNRTRELSTYLQRGLHAPHSRGIRAAGDASRPRTCPSAHVLHGPGATCWTAKSGCPSLTVQMAKWPLPGCGGAGSAAAAETHTCAEGRCQAPDRGVLKHVVQVEAGPHNPPPIFCPHLACSSLQIFASLACQGASQFEFSAGSSEKALLYKGVILRFPFYEYLFPSDKIGFLTF